MFRFVDFHQIRFFIYDEMCMEYNIVTFLSPLELIWVHVNGNLRK